MAKPTTAVRHGEHGTEAPPHMLTDVSFELVRLDERTPDGRLIKSEGFGVRDLPLSFSALFTTAHGMPGEAVIVGSMDEVTVEPDGRVWGQGWLLDEPDARRTGRLLQAGALRGNSVELSASKVALSLSEDDELLQDYVESKISATTVVANPAMEQCTVTLNVPDYDFGETAMAEANAMAGEMASFTDLAPAVFTAAAPVLELPAAYNFAQPEFTAPSPVREVEGLVQGHVALWDTPHLGDSRIRPPHSATDYAYFATGEVLTDEGMVATGRLVIGSDHPDLSLDWRASLDEYAATCLAWADVAIGEDDFGIWVSGIVRPGVDPTVLHAARASGVSGDWRRIGGNLELVAVLSVNGPGFPVPAAFMDGDRMTAIAGFGVEVASPEMSLEEAVRVLTSTTQTLAPMAHHFEAERLTKRYRDELRAEAAAIVKKI